VLHILFACLYCTVVEWWVASVVICLERGADLHMAQLMPLPLTVSCYGKIQIGFTFLVRLTQVVPDKGPLYMCVCLYCTLPLLIFFSLLFLYLSPPLLMFSFEDRPASFSGQMHKRQLNPAKLLTCVYFVL